ncbi:hypothetical protein [Candidatus Sororendozoicomonas aggregata]|uniref:hypothetical protein n=1 Tax=Candidatus Sororendozoicomonas aggregata TaxID=3073239 RepID=UPI002ED49D17
MESLLVIILGVFVLHYLSQRQDQAAEKLIGGAFDRFERIYNGVKYACLDATVVRRSLHREIALPLVPSPNYSARALCRTEEGDWFWFDSEIRFMKLKHTRITPCSKKEALEALKDTPEILQHYFPDCNKQQQSA